MSTKEILYSIIDNMTETQMKGLIMFLSEEKKKTEDINHVRGALSAYADPGLMPLENGAWERSVIQNNENA